MVGDLTSKGTLAPSQIVFQSATNGRLAARKCYTVTSPLSPISIVDRISEVPLLDEN